MKKPTTFKELFDVLTHFLPGYQVGQDNDGQIVIYTNLMPSPDDDGAIVDFDGDQTFREAS